jgi:hypothetical protein
MTGGVANKNGSNASNPFRLSPAQALTSDQGHNESPEQSAYDNGWMLPGLASDPEGRRPAPSSAGDGVHATPSRRCGITPSISH